MVGWVRVALIAARRHCRGWRYVIEESAVFIACDDQHRISPVARHSNRLIDPLDEQFPLAYIVERMHGIAIHGLMARVIAGLNEYVLGKGVQAQITFKAIHLAELLG